MQRALCLFLCLLAARVSTLHADTVVFKKGTRLECKVVADTPEGLLVLLGNEDKGSMILDRSTIERVEYDYDSRLAEILAREKEEGRKLYTEHYDLGIWCEEHALDDPLMYDRALDRYLYSRDKPDIPNEVYLRLGRMYEKCKEPNPGEAYNAYAEYLRRQPDSAEAEQAVKRLAEEIEKNKPVTPAQKLPAGEGLEMRVWNWERWSNPGTVRSVKDTGNERTVVLEGKYKSGAKDKTAFAYPINGNLDGKKALLFDVYNPEGRALQIAMAVVTGGNYEWYESKMVRAEGKKWTLGMRFDLTESQWKSKQTGWAHRGKPDNLAATRNLVLLVYNYTSDGTIFIDNIRFEE